MHAPLTKWWCDVCGDLIEDAERGYVIWKRTGTRYHDFKIIHKARCDRRDHQLSKALPEFLGNDGLAYLLSELSIGPILVSNLGRKSSCDLDLDEFVDLVRRVQTPHYEEARRKFSKYQVREDYSDAGEATPYMPTQLKKIAGGYDDDE